VYISLATNFSKMHLHRVCTSTQKAPDSDTNIAVVLVARYLCHIIQCQMHWNRHLNIDPFLTLNVAEPVWKCCRAGSVLWEDLGFGLTG